MDEHGGHGAGHIDWPHSDGSLATKQVTLDLDISDFT